MRKHINSHVCRTVALSRSKSSGSSDPCTVWEDLVGDGTRRQKPCADARVHGFVSYQVLVEEEEEGGEEGASASVEGGEETEGASEVEGEETEGASVVGGGVEGSRVRGGVVAGGGEEEVSVGG